MSLFLPLIRLFRKESFPGFPLQKQSCSHSIACISKIQSDFSTVFRPFVDTEIFSLKISAAVSLSHLHPAAGLQLMFMLVLLLRRKPAADMPLRLVDIQNHSRLCRQGRIDMDQTIRHILVYSRN